MAFEDIREKLFDRISKTKDPKSLLKDQGMEEAKLCDFVRGKIEDVRTFGARISSEGIWLTNIAYIVGFDALYYDTDIRQFRPQNMAAYIPNDSRVTVNAILPRAQNRAARLCKNPPRYDVKPKSSSEEDRDAARMGLYLINQIWDNQQINRKRLELMMWVQQCGHAYLKTCWDKQLGPKVPMTDPSTGQVKMVPMGDIRVDVVNAFEMFPDPIAKSFDELGWIVQAKIRPVHYFIDQYGDKGRLVMPEDAWLTSLQYEYRINAFNSQGGQSSGISALVKNSATELSYYEKPSYRHPNGRHIITANGILLKDGPLPIDELPFSKFDDVLVAGKYYSESVITHCRPIQDQYNRTISKRAEWTNKMLAGKYLAARGHGLMQSALDDGSGEVVEYDNLAAVGVPAPSYMPTPAIPEYAYKETEFLEYAMDNIFGLGEASQGGMPSASIPAIGLQYLVEQDMTRIGVVTEQNEFAYAGTGRQILKFAENYYTAPRLLRCAGKGMEYTVKEFIGSEINGNNDVTVIRNSTIPTSKVLRRQEIINLHQGGYLGEPNDPKVRENVLDMLEYGDIQEVWKDHSLDMGQVKRHIDMIEQGVKPPVSEFDNHPLFLKELNRVRKSDKFGTWPEEHQFILMNVMEEHVQEMMNLMNPGTEMDPSLEMSTAAQENEEEVYAKEGVPVGTDPQELMANVEQPPPIEENLPI